MQFAREARVLGDPNRTFREMAASPQRDVWTLIRRPLLLAFAMGLLLSLESSARLSLRTVVDGMISFAFLPLVEILAVGAIYLRTDRRLPFARVVDAFFVSNSPWLLWILGFCLWRIPRTAVENSTFAFSTVIVILLTMLVPICWSAYLDLLFFRIVLPRRARSAAMDLGTARAIGWVGGLGYFLGIALWAQAVAWMR